MKRTNGNVKARFSCLWTPKWQTLTPQSHLTIEGLSQFPFFLPTGKRHLITYSITISWFYKMPNSRLKQRLLNTIRSRPPCWPKWPQLKKLSKSTKDPQVESILREHRAIKAKVSCLKITKMVKKSTLWWSSLPTTWKKELSRTGRLTQSTLCFRNIRTVSHLTLHDVNLRHLITTRVGSESLEKKFTKRPNPNKRKQVRTNQRKSSKRRSRMKQRKWFMNLFRPCPPFNLIKSNSAESLKVLP